MAASLADLIQHKLTQDAQNHPAWHGVNHPRSNFYQPEPQPEPPAPPAWFTEALAKLDSLSARCDALIERNGVWTRYVTGDDSNDVS